MKQIVRQQCLSLSNGEVIYLFTLTNARGTEVCITNYGAIITKFRIRRQDGSFTDIVLGFDRIEEYWAPDYLKTYPWFGSVVGRYANRIKDARFILDGREFLLTKNNGEEQLHGGINGFDKKSWEIITYGKDPNPFLELRYLSRDGEEGFPGNLDTTVKYELNEDDELSYVFRAITDQPTPVNMTQHSYFNLDNTEGTIKDHELRIYASHRLEQERNLVVTGKYLDIAETAYDFREFKRIGNGLEMVPEFDTSYVIDKAAIADASLVAETRSSQSNLWLQLYSTEPVVHFYSGKWIPSVIGKNGIHYKAFSGFCLETHKHPNAVNVGHFPNTILRPGEVYYQKTIYKVIQDWLK